jgi:tetratricopeptide (TPR) repeat protein
VPDKIRRDLVSICGQGSPVERVLYFTVASVPVGTRNTLINHARDDHHVDLEIFDAVALTKLLTRPELYYLAERYLGLPPLPGPSDASVGGLPVGMPQDSVEHRIRGREALLTALEKRVATVGGRMVLHGAGGSGKSVGGRLSPTLAARHELADLLLELGEAEQAIEEFEETLRLEAQLLGHDHLSTLVTRHNRCYALLYLNRLDEAEAELLDIHATWARIAPRGHTSSHRVRGALATVLAATGRTAEAEEHFRAVAEALAAALGPTHAEVIEARLGRAETLRRLDRHAEAQAVCSPWRPLSSSPTASAIPVCSSCAEPRRTCTSRWGRTPTQSRSYGCWLRHRPMSWAQNTRTRCALAARRRPSFSARGSSTSPATNWPPWWNHWPHPSAAATGTH